MDLDRKNYFIFWEFFSAFGGLAGAVGLVGTTGFAGGVGLVASTNALESASRALVLAEAAADIAELNAAFAAFR